jgi:hypothetical protein
MVRSSHFGFRGGWLHIYACDFPFSFEVGWLLFFFSVFFFDWMFFGMRFSTSFCFFAFVVCVGFGRYAGRDGSRGGGWSGCCGWRGFAMMGSRRRLRRRHGGLGGGLDHALPAFERFAPGAPSFGELLAPEGLTAKEGLAT